LRQAFCLQPVRLVCTNRGCSLARSPFTLTEVSAAPLRSVSVGVEQFAQRPIQEMTMLQGSKVQKILAPTDFEGLAAQFSVLREDMAALTQSVAAMAERRGRSMASDISDGVEEAIHYVERKGQSAEADLEKTVTAHPFMALGLAAGACLLIGAMTRR
jgi:ElaB/YqjD/DUF883 family membrane-anchored ribosome-binding protein